MLLAYAHTALVWSPPWWLCLLLECLWNHVTLWNFWRHMTLWCSTLLMSILAARLLWSMKFLIHSDSCSSIACRLCSGSGLLTLTAALLLRAEFSHAPVGKQRLHPPRRPSGIFYTANSGIWQTVWLEPVSHANTAWHHSRDSCLDSNIVIVITIILITKIINLTVVITIIIVSPPAYDEMPVQTWTLVRSKSRNVAKALDFQTLIW